jgi:hypothetical protein
MPKLRFTRCTAAHVAATVRAYDYCILSVFPGRR